MADRDSSSGPSNSEPGGFDSEIWHQPARASGTRARVDPKALETALSAALGDDRFTRLNIVDDTLVRLLSAERLDGSAKNVERLTALALDVVDDVQARLKLVQLPLSALQHQRLRSTLAVLHQLALLQLQQSTGPGFAASAPAARVRALVLWAEHSLLRWSFYQPSDDRFWARCAALLNSLIRDNALETTVTLARPRLGLSSITASQAFAQIAVVAVSQPSALPHDAGRALFEWAGQTPLAVAQTRHRPIPNAPSIVAFDLNARHAPVILSDVRLPMRAGLWFSLEPLVQRLRDARIDRFARSPDDGTLTRSGPPRDPLAHLSDHLIRVWTHKPTRRHSRVPVDATVIALTGLQAIHRQLDEWARQRRAAVLRDASPDERRANDRHAVDRTPADPVPDPTDAAAPDDGSRATPKAHASIGRRGEVEVFVLTGDHDAPAWAIEPTTGPAATTPPLLGSRELGTAEAAWLAAERGLDAVGPAPASPPKASPARQWTLRNRSAGGLSLHIREAPPGTLLIGELLALSAPQAAADAPSPVGLLRPTTWQIGVLRWLQETQPDVLEAGFERIATDPTHGEAFRLRNRRAQGDPVPILLARAERPSDGTVLLMPAFAFEGESQIVLRVAGVSRIVELQPIDTVVSPLFQMRRFRIVSDTRLADPSAPGHGDAAPGATQGPDGDDGELSIL